MITIAVAMLAFGAGEPAVLWLNACEIDPNGVEIGQEGTYIVWVWAPGDQVTKIVIAGEERDVKKEGEQTAGYVWLSAGKHALRPGKVKIEPGERIAAIALCTDARFSPEQAMNDRRVLKEPEAAVDRRAETVRHTDTVFTMPAFASLEDWEPFAARLRQRVLLSSGLWPLPERTPLNARVFDRVVHDDYTVEKVHFEARPGFLVTGNLYRPVGDGPFPGVACPHGHWGEGRLANEDAGSVPGRCITLARMGCVAFSYDMIGYKDSQQFKHRWGNEREKLWGIHPFGFQLWTSLRVVDFLQGLPDVDPERIACTGASGGGTQTFSLMAVEPRVKVAAPVNMISCSMQGGCLCENAPILRFDCSNQEIGALMAPRPLLMVSATGDWTRETPRIEFPAVRSIFDLYGVPERVENVHIDAGHNYNQSSREAMYRFFGKWLLNDADKWTDFTEPRFEVEPAEALRVFPDGPPKDAPDADEIIAQTIETTRAKWAAILPKKAAEFASFREEYGSALPLTLGVTAPDPNDIAPERVGFEERGTYVVEHWILRRPVTGDAVPAILYRSSTAAPQDAVLLVHGAGKAALAGTIGPGPLVAGLIAQGKAVMSIDTFLTGEHHSPWKRTERRREGNFMDTFQPTDTAYRVQDVLTALAYLQFRRDLTDTVDLVGLGEAGVWCLFAAAIDDGVRCTVVDANRFDVNSDQAWVDTYYVPCIRSIGDVVTAGALIAPRRLIIGNTGDAFDTAGIAKVYAAAQSNSLTVQPDVLAVESIIDALR